MDEACDVWIIDNNMHPKDAIYQTRNDKELRKEKIPSFKTRQEAIEYYKSIGNEKYRIRVTRTVEYTEEMTISVKSNDETHATEKAEGIADMLPNDVWNLSDEERYESPSRYVELEYIDSE